MSFVIMKGHDKTNTPNVNIRCDLSVVSWLPCVTLADCMSITTLRDFRVNPAHVCAGGRRHVRRWEKREGDAHANELPIAVYHACKTLLFMMKAAVKCSRAALSERSRGQEADPIACLCY